MQTILDNAATTAQMFDLFKRGEFDKLVAMMHPRVIWTVSGTAPIPYARTYKGQKDVVSFFPALANAINFSEFVPEKIINAEDHLVLAIGHFIGTVNATGKEINSEWIMLFEFDEEGTLVRFKDYVDTQNIANAFQ